MSEMPENNHGDSSQSEPIDFSILSSEEPQSTQKPPKAPRKISLSVFLLSAIALVLAAVMLTYTLCNSAYKRRLAELQVTQNKYYSFELLDTIFASLSFQELDEEEMLTAALKAYVAATGDRYAEYYTAEEYDELASARVGDTVGVGINVVETTVTVDGYVYKAFCVVNVMQDSPAQKAGVLAGDMIWAVGTADDRETVSELDYDLALTRMKGLEGTEASFSVFRSTEGTYGSDPIDFTIARAKVTTSSVRYNRSEADPSVGIVKIIQFDLTTPPQFSAAMDALLSQGCTSFVYDVRYNPGGDLASIEAVLSYFLEEGDVIIRTKDVQGEESASTVQAVTYTGDYASCNVTKEDIGKYRGLDAVVLCNGTTASAGELFTATFMDYDLATVIGTKTFGKGSMQSFIMLEKYGVEGALKLTTNMYYSAKRDSYDGIGIEPDVTVELSEEAAKQNIYMLSEADDNQLQAALAHLKK